MDVRKAIRSRRSIRSNESREAEEEKLMRVLESGAPSARKVRRFVIISDARTRKALSEDARDQTFAAQAPGVIAACSGGSEYGMGWSN